jgi:hypothetical protein
VLLATVTGQDIEETLTGASGSSRDRTHRVISMVDPQARHGHKTAAHGFDGYKAHVAVDPDAEVICAAEVSQATLATPWSRRRWWATWPQARATRPPSQ